MWMLWQKAWEGRGKGEGKERKEREGKGGKRGREREEGSEDGGGREREGRWRKKRHKTKYC